MRTPPPRRLELDILPQPDETTCGPTCLDAVYRYWGDPVPLDQVIEEVETLPQGGTLGVLLACHALRRGYRATIYTYNLQVFDPTWFEHGFGDLAGALRTQGEHKRDPRLEAATQGYLDMLALGGVVRLEDLRPALLRRHLERGVPLLTGLSATWLYRSMREMPDDGRPDDVRGGPAGHFVVVHGYDGVAGEALVADPLQDNPIRPAEHSYAVDLDRLVTAILLGTTTHDANLLVIEPGERP